MTEMVFPLVGGAFVICVVLPACAALVKASLLLLERHTSAAPLRRLHTRYLLLLAPTTLPLAWFVSAGLHQAESGKNSLACLFHQHATALCFEAAFFALVLLLVMCGRALPVMRGRERVAADANDHDALSARVDGIVRRTPALHALRDRLRVSSDPEFALGTEGYVRPRVVIGAAFAERLSDEALASALAHEAEHVRSRDPLRYLLLELSLALNPWGRFLLAPHASRWCAAREAECDRHAVVRGCEPLPLAEAIVQAARPNRQPSVPLGVRDTRLLRFRIDMLLAFAERKPSRAAQSEAPLVAMGLALLVLTLLLPHRTSTAALDVLHLGAENALTFFWR